MKFELRNYQKQAIEETEAMIAFGSTNIVLEAPTGAGKGAIAAEMCKRFDDKNIIFAVTMTSLIDQLANELTRTGLQYSIIKAGRDNEFDSDARIHIAMVQTLYSRIEDIDIECDILMKDERHHHYNTKMMLTIQEKFKPETIIGFTATPYDADGFKLKDSEIVRTIGINELTELGFLAPLKYYIPKWAEKVDYSSLKKSGDDYNQNQLNELINNKHHLDKIVDSMNKLDAKNKKTIVFVTNTDIADDLTLVLRNNGYHAFSFHSKLHSKDEENILNAFRNNTLFDGYYKQRAEKSLFDGETKPEPVKCLVSVAKLIAGFDVPDTELAVIATPTRTRSKVVQSVGRVRRVAKGKKHGAVLDLGQVISKFGFPEDPYNPPERTNDDQLNKKLITEENEKHALEHVVAIIDDEPTEINREFYVKRVEEIKRNKDKLTNLNIKDLVAKLEISEDHVEMIAIAAVLFDKIHSEDMIDDWGRPCRGYISNKGKPVRNFLNSKSIGWISELWSEILPKEDEYYRKKYIKALRTRIKNLLKEKGSIYALRFFIEYLLEQDETEKMIKDRKEPASPEVLTEEQYKTQMEIVIEDEEVPFAYIGLSEGKYYQFLI